MLAQFPVIKAPIDQFLYNFDCCGVVVLAVLSLSTDFVLPIALLVAAAHKWLNLRGNACILLHTVMPNSFTSMLTGVPPINV